jgi:hypothetical protein
VKPQDHHPQSVLKQAEETTKAKTERKQTQTLTRKPKRKPCQGGTLPGENRPNARKQLQQLTMNPDEAREDW